MKKYMPHFFTVTLAITALIYNSWPLGYWLDNHTAKFGVPSDLEDPHHAYSWVFICGDVITALLILALTLYLARRLVNLRLRYAWVSLTLGLFLFGFFTGFGAAAPDRCHGRFSACLVILQDKVSVDGIESTLAFSGLLIALFSIAILSLGLNRYYQLLAWIMFICWFILGAIFFHRSVYRQNIHNIEQVFLVLSGIGLVISGMVIDKYKLITQPPI